MSSKPKTAPTTMRTQGYNETKEQTNAEDNKVRSANLVRNFLGEMLSSNENKPYFDSSHSLNVFGEEKVDRKIFDSTNQPGKYLPGDLINKLDSLSITTSPQDILEHSSKLSDLEAK